MNGVLSMKEWLEMLADDTLAMRDQTIDPAERLKLLNTSIRTQVAVGKLQESVLRGLSSGALTYTQQTQLMLGDGQAES